MFIRIFWGCLDYIVQCINGLKGKSTPETIDFPSKKLGLFGFNFPLNQSIEPTISG